MLSRDFIQSQQESTVSIQAIELCLPAQNQPPHSIHGKPNIQADKHGTTELLCNIKRTSFTVTA
jgi:hypothetical protein